MTYKIIETNTYLVNFKQPNEKKVIESIEHSNLNDFSKIKFILGGAGIGKTKASIKGVEIIEFNEYIYKNKNKYLERVFDKLNNLSEVEDKFIVFSLMDEIVDILNEKGIKFIVIYRENLNRNKTVVKKLYDKYSFKRSIILGKNTFLSDISEDLLLFNKEII